MKLIFWVQDDDGNVVGEKKQIELDIPSEDVLAAADAKDASEIAEVGEKFPENVTNAIAAMRGRNKILHDMFMSAGIIVGKFLELSLAKRYGGDRNQRLENARRQIENKESAV